MPVENHEVYGNSYEFFAVDSLADSLTMTFRPIAHSFPDTLKLFFYFHNMDIIDSTDCHFSTNVSYSAVYDQGELLGFNPWFHGITVFLTDWLADGSTELTFTMRDTLPTEMPIACTNIINGTSSYFQLAVNNIWTYRNSSNDDNGFSTMLEQFVVQDFIMTEDSLTNYIVQRTIFTEDHILTLLETDTLYIDGNNNIRSISSEYVNVMNSLMPWWEYSMYHSEVVYNEVYGKIMLQRYEDRDFPGGDAEGYFHVGLGLNFAWDAIWGAGNWSEGLIGGRLSGYEYGYHVPLNVRDLSLIPSEFKLWTFPNPFNGIISIRVESSENPETIRIYSLNGVLIQNLKINSRNSHSIDLNWDGSNLAGDQVSSGIYLIVVARKSDLAVKKITLLK